MTFRLRSTLAGLTVAGVLAIGSTAIVTAARPGLAGGPAGKGVCATQATAMRAGASVETLRAFGDCEIGRRITTLDTLASRISGSKVLTSSDKAALSAEISSTKSGLTSLKSTIDSETAITALRADIVKIATDYRVYVLVAPKVHLVSAADGVLAIQPKFADISTRLTARIAAAKAAGKDTTVAEAKLAAMNAAVAQAVALAQPIPAKLLPLTPANWNSGTAGPILNQARTDLGQARGLLRTARQAARDCRAALK